MAKLKLAIKNVDQFSKALATGVKQLKSGKKNLWNAALFALHHYETCGDHGKINMVLSSLLDAGVGAGAYRKWIETYSDQIYSTDEKKFVRDEDNKLDHRANTQAASNENFWIGVARASEDELEFGFDDLTKELNKVLNRFGKRKPSDAKASETLEFFKRQLKAKNPAVEFVG